MSRLPRTQTTSILRSAKIAGAWCLLLPVAYSAIATNAEKQVTMREGFLNFLLESTLLSRN
jgi:hypothetical protein